MSRAVRVGDPLTVMRIGRVDPSRLEVRGPRRGCPAGTVRVDYARGADEQSGLYVALNEAF